VKYKQVRLIEGVDKLNQWLENNTDLEIVDIKYSATESYDLFVVIWNKTEVKSQ